MKKLNRDERGFSLVEVIVAVVILGIIVVPLMHTLVTGARTAQLGIETEKTTNAAQSLMELAKAQGVGALYDSSDAKKLHSSAIFPQNPTGETKTYVIPQYSSAGREYFALVDITPDDEKNEAELAKSNPMDISFDMQYADSAEKSAYRTACMREIEEYDEETGEITFSDTFYPDTAKLERIGISITATRESGEGGSWDYTVTAALSYRAAAYSEQYGERTVNFAGYEDTKSSTATIKGVKVPEYGDAAFSVYLLYDAYFAGSETESIAINNYESISERDSDFNVFLVNTSKSPAGSFKCDVIYQCQRFSGEDTCVRVFTNIPSANVSSYKAYKNGVDSVQLAEKISGLLVEQATRQRRFQVSVRLYEPAEAASVVGEDPVDADDITEIKNKEALWQLDSEMMV